jgi:S-adenosylmethionine decarboxylase
MATKYLGKHLIVEFYGCPSNIIDNKGLLEEILVESVDRAEGKIIGKIFHKFNPQGVTGIIAIAESHVSIHTWPENGYMALDVFTCGSKVDPWKIYKAVAEKIKHGHVKVVELNRGEMVEVEEVGRV